MGGDPNPRCRSKHPLETGMHPPRILPAMAILAPWLFLLPNACGPVVDAGSAPRLSPKALEMVRELKGQSLHFESLGPGGEPLYIKDCYVGPNPISGHGAVVVLATNEALAGPTPVNAPQGADGQWYLPLSTDGDAAHLLIAAGANPPPGMFGPPSRLYSRVVGLP